MTGARSARSLWRGLACALTLVLSLTIAAQAVAQALTDTDFGEWASMVQRVDRVLDADRANEPTLDRLRGDVAAFRDRFLLAESVNADRVARVRGQINSLGAAPAEGETEPPDVAERRAALNRELADLQAPGLRAREAFAEADGLVRQIDAELRERQTAAVFRRYDLPINPLNWQVWWKEASTVLLAGPDEVLTRIADPEGRAEVLGNLPSAALSLIAGSLLVFRSRYWTDRVRARVNAITRRPVRRALRLLIVLSQLALPLMGLSLLAAALQLTGVFGPTGTAVLFALVVFGYGMIVGTWIVRNLFPRDPDEFMPLRLNPAFLGKGRRMATTLVVLLSLNQGLRILDERMPLSDQTVAYSGFILSSIAAIAVFRLARFFRRTAQRDAEAPTEAAFVDSVIGVVSATAMLLSVLALLAGLAGYVALSEDVVFAMARTFFLFGMLSLVQRALSGFYGLISRRGDQVSEDGLAPVLIGSVLLIASVPFFALIWGARANELLELWTQVRTGFDVGGVRISPTEFLTFALIFAVGYGLTRLVQGALTNSILPRTSLDKGARTALVSGLGYLGIFLAGLVAITAAGINLSTFAIFASALAVGIGFGLQTIVSNFVSGIILLIERPISEGDWIEVGDQMGIVRAISVRATRIETFDRTDVIIPNADFVSGTVTNWTRSNMIGRVTITVSVAYGTDTKRVEALLREIAMEHPMVNVNPPPGVFFTGFGADGLDFVCYCIINDVSFKLATQSELNHAIAARFAAEGIEIPFAQRDIWLRNPQVLQAPLRHAEHQAGVDGGARSVPAPDARHEERGDWMGDGTPERA